MPESIFNLVPVEVPKAERPPMYRSSHDPRSPINHSTFGTHGTTMLLGAGHIKKQGSATFGKPLNSSLPDPKRYLKGHDKCKTVEPRSTATVERFTHRLTGDHAKTGVPRRDERPVMGIKTTKNFITSNAVEAILQVPRLKNTAEPDYLKKADYAKVPAYLAQVKEEIRRENDMIDSYVKEQMGYGGGDENSNEVMEVLGDGERFALVDALKSKWDAVNANYQKLTHNVYLDTVGKIKRKEAMESELKMLESDISKLEKPQPIYIRN